MIRLARLADLPAITRVRTSVRENHLSVEQMAERGITETVIAQAMSSGKLVSWIAEANTEVAAFAMVEPETGKLFALFTHPDHEGCGHGTALLATAEQSLHLAGCRAMILDTGEATSAVAFYEKRGFVITSTCEGDVIMAKKLA
jgi:GNAT superfamily N-acetyltransferase